MFERQIKVLIICICLPFSMLKAQNNSQKPKLVVGVVVDQMRYDYLSRYAEKYSDNGFKRLLAEGFSFENNNLNYVPTNTAPGHASIYTGTTPSVHGILGNSWYDKETHRAISCVYDADYEPVGTGVNSERKSPKNLLVDTISDFNAMATEQEGKTISIALKDRAAILSGGHEALGSFWFSGGDLGFWITSSYYMDTLPEWVREFNDSGVAESYMKPWNTLDDINTYTESEADVSDYERGFRSKTTSDFPYDLKALSVENGGYVILKSTPYGNSLTLDFALKALEGEKLGEDDITDFLLISFSSTDYIGHNFGVDSKEVEDAYIRLDRDIARLLKTLDDKVGENGYTLFLTADHGASQNGHVLEDKGEVSGYFREGTFRNDLRTHMFELYRDANVIENLSDNQVFLDKQILQNLGLAPKTVQQEIKTFIESYPQIAKVATRDDFETHNFKDGLLRIMQNGFNFERSGDVFYILEPNVVVYSDQGSSHGSPYDFDTHVPLLFYGVGIASGSTPERTNSTMIAPTIARILDIQRAEHFNAPSLPVKF